MIKAKILIVEDEVIIARDLSQMLRKLGHNVLDYVMTGEQAISQAAALEPDLVLMDIRLAGKMDGIEAAVQIRAAQDIPVMFLTGNTDEATLERAKAAAPLGYLPKPISERDLRVWVEMGLHKARLENRVRASERYLYSVLSAVGDAVIATDSTWRIHEFNPAAEALTGWSAKQVLGSPLEEVLTIVAEDGTLILDDSIKAVLRGEVYREWHGDHWLQRRDGSRIPLSYTCNLMKTEDGNSNGLVFAFRDVSARKSMEAERERLIGDLRAALDNIKTLSGLIPICAGCKQIRDDQGYWQCVEQFVQERSDAQFSHSMCPECVRKFYPQYADDVLARMDSRVSEIRLSGSASRGGAPGDPVRPAPGVIQG